MRGIDVGAYAAREGQLRLSWKAAQDGARRKVDLGLHKPVGTLIQLD